MAEYGRISKAIVKAIADALRFCNGNEAQYTPGQMPNAVRLLKKRLTQKTITRNGVYIPTSGYDGFDRVTVNVQGGGGDAVLVSKNIIANGNYSAVDDSADGYSSVSVAVPGPNLQSKTATQNGTVTPDTGYDGLSAVDVAVPNTYSAADNGKVVSGGALVEQTGRSVAANGTYDTTGNNSVTVNVPSQAAPVLQPKTVTENGDYYPPSGVDGFSEIHVNVQGGSGSAVVQPLSVTQNGTYNPPSGVDGYAPVTVLVPSSGGDGPIYYGTSAPLSSLGNNEDLYIQYQVMTSAFDHTYGIVAEFRKVGGVWVQYEKPVPPTIGVHIWTKSTGGNDAAMYVQNGYWDGDNNMFVATGEVESVLYSTVGYWNTAKNCNDIALLAYPNGWQVKASTTITDGTNTYQTDAIVKQWDYQSTVDFYIWKPAS